MRKILLLALTLAVVGIVSAALLTGVNNWTAPVIADRQHAEYFQAVKEYFPTVDSSETVEFEGDSYDLIYDGSGALLGVVGTIGQDGYEGTITYNLVVNRAGEITGLRIVSHTETPGIGCVIEEPGFQGQFIGKTFEDPIQAGADVDIVSGATISTAAIIGSIRRSIADVAVNFLGIEADILDITAVPDGTYQGTGNGFLGDIVVEVTVKDGRIIAIEVLEQEETPTYFVDAYPLIPERIIEEQSLAVDTQTGATASAEGIMEAVRNALEKALTLDINAVPDGVYQGSGSGLMGNIVVEVTVAGGKITAIEVLEHGETPSYFEDAYPATPDRIIEAQNLDVDTTSGATASSEGIIGAVRDALEKALAAGGEE